MATRSQLFFTQKLTNQWHPAAIGVKLWQKEGATLHSQVPVLILLSQWMNSACLGTKCVHQPALEAMHSLFPQGRKALIFQQHTTFTHCVSLVSAVYRSSTKLTCANRMYKISVWERAFAETSFCSDNDNKKRGSNTFPDDQASFY